MFGAAIELAFDTESAYECCNMRLSVQIYLLLHGLKISLYLVLSLILQLSKDFWKLVAIFSQTINKTAHQSIYSWIPVLQDIAEFGPWVMKPQDSFTNFTVLLKVR